MDMDIPHSWGVKLGGTTGEQDKPLNPGFQCREIKHSKPLTEKPVGIEAVGEIPSLIGELVGETHRVLDCTQNQPPGVSTRRAQFACGQK